jgi:hypothetical protein
VLTLLCFISGDGARLRADQLARERVGSVQLGIFLESPLVGGSCFAAVSAKSYLRTLSPRCSRGGRTSFFSGCWRLTVTFSNSLLHFPTKDGAGSPWLISTWVCSCAESRLLGRSCRTAQLLRACCSHPTRACLLFASNPCAVFLCVPSTF